MCSYVENPLNRGLHPPPPLIPVYSIIFTLVGRLAPLFPSLLLLFLCHSSPMFRSRFTHFSLSILSSSYQRIFLPYFFFVSLHFCFYFFQEENKLDRSARQSSSIFKKKPRERERTRTSIGMQKVASIIDRL